jgi:hypothetical protein
MLSETERNDLPFVNLSKLLLHARLDDMKQHLGLDQSGLEAENIDLRTTNEA